jgi:hypothetical protein
MSNDAEADEEDVAAFFRPSASTAAAGSSCPAPDLLQAAKAGTLPDRLQAAILTHLTHCSMCRALDQALAEVLDTNVTADQKGRIWNRVSAGLSERPWRRSMRTWAPLAAAAMVVLALSASVIYQVRQSPGSPIQRGAESSSIRSLIAPEAIVPRSACELTWSADLGDARYDVFVTDEDLNALARGTSLDTQRFIVPAAALTPVPSGARILWRVEALLPGGRRYTSPTFTTRVQ